MRDKHKKDEEFEHRRVTRSSRRKNEEDEPVLKKIKKEPIEEDDQLEETRKRCLSDLYSDSDLFHNDSNVESLDGEQNAEEEEWQTELRLLIRDGETTLDDYSTDSETTLKWVVKHGIRLAITCTECSLIEHDDGAQSVQDHGLLCGDTKKEDHEGDGVVESGDADEFTVNIVDLPRPNYSDRLQLSLRKSLERKNSWLMDLPLQLSKLPIKFIMGRNGKKRAGICTFCGDIFLSTDHKKWNHECWTQDNEVNGFLIDENECAKEMDQSSTRNANSLQDLLDKTTQDNENPDGSGENSLSEQRLTSGVRLYDRDWALSIRERLTRGELKTKPMISDPNYFICYIINPKGIIMANFCTNCSRVFSPSISASNRSRHISVCGLALKRENVNITVVDQPQHSEVPLADKLRSQLNVKNVRSRKAYMLKKMDKHTDYNINLEALMSKTLASDLLPTDVFYASGMKVFFNKLLKIGYDLGQQPGTVLPNYDEFLPSRATTESNLTRFIGMDRFQETFHFITQAFHNHGGTIAVESIGNRNPALSGNTHVAISFLVSDGLVPKRFVADLIPYGGADEARPMIEALLSKHGIQMDKCNLFVNKPANGLLSLDEFPFKSSCFGDLLDRLAEDVFDSDALGDAFVEQTQQQLADVKAILDKAPSCFKFIQSHCSLSTDIRLVLRCEFDQRWFVRAAWAQKLCLLLKSHNESLMNSLLDVDEAVLGRTEVIEFIEKATKHLPRIQQYASFVQILVDSIEPCSVSRRATAHLVVLKFHLVRQQLKAVVDRNEPKERLHRDLCSISLDNMDLCEDEFLGTSHFLATLLAPGHRDQLKRWYEENRLLDLENHLINAVRSFLSLSKQPDSDEPDGLDIELERYFEATAPSLVDPLEWWSENEELMPRVAKFARRIFTIPAVSTLNDKTLPGHLSNMHLSDFMRRRILFNWAANSELQIKRERKGS